MANDVFANGREVACKAGSGETISAFPDVCFTPPENPATPPGVPVPYPDFGYDKDTTNGSRSVKISDEEVLLKNISYYKQLDGDEAGNTAKKGMISSTKDGEIYFCSWTMNVKYEGKNIVRHIDIATHNHACSPANNSIPMIRTDRMALINSVEHCDKEISKIKEMCGDPIDENKAKCPDPTAVETAKQEHAAAVAMPRGDARRKKSMAAAIAKVHAAHEKYAEEINNNDCTRALKCALVPYDKGTKGACCPHSTPDHLVPAAQFGPDRGKNHPNYKASKAPCMCATGGAQTATHGLLGRGRTSYMEKNNIKVNSHKKVWTVADSCACGADSASEVTDCTKECIEAQLKKGHEDMDVDLNEKISTRKETVKRDLTPFENKLLGPPVGQVGFPSG